MAGKGKGKKKEKEPKDKFTNMEEDKLIEFIQKTKEQIKEVKVKRNFVQQERDMITEFYEISKQEEKKLRDACEKEEIVMDHLQREHQNEINAFINKYRHLEYDHELFINEKLPNKSQEALDKEEEIRGHREDIYMQKKQELKDNIKTNTVRHRDQIESKKSTLQHTFDDKKNQLEERLKNIIRRYKQKMKQLAADLELRLKVEIHELEERKNKKCFENENIRLKKKLKDNNEFNHCNDYHNGALWMAQKTCDEMNKFEKNINELYGLYEEKVKNSINNTNDNSFNNRIVDNSVNWFFKALKSSISESKTKMNDWKNDEQRNLNSLGFSIKHINH